MKFSVVSLLAVVLASSVALAKPSVAVLGLEVTGEVDQPATVAARDLTEGMRARAKVSSGPYQLAPNSNRELIDEKVLKDCNTEAPSCMASIGRDLRADVLVYGKVEKVAGGGYRMTVTALDVGKKSVLGRTVVKVPASASGEKLRAIAKDAYAELAGEIAPMGTVILESNVSSGEVFVDDEAQGRLRNGAVQLSLPPGRYRIAIEAEGYRRKEVSILVSSSETRTESLELSPVRAGERDGGKGDLWKPTFVAAAVVTAGLAGFSTYEYVQMKGLENNLPAGSTEGSCKGATEGSLQEACSHFKKHEISAYAAIGTGALVLVSGYFAFFHDRSGERDNGGKLAITPQLSPDGAGATLSFGW